MLAIVTHPACVDHDTGPTHPERPDRHRALHRALRQSGLLRSPDPYPEFRFDSGLRDAGVTAIEASGEPVTDEAILLVHPPEHLRAIRHVCEVGGGVLDQGDTPVCPSSDAVARLSLGCALRAVDLVAGGAARRAFAVARPPGHHAEPDRAMGFCLYSNIAIAARRLQTRHGVGRIAIVDFDVHHGNGTQAVFEADDSVLFISLHQHPQTCYPGTGHAWEIGAGRGRGFTLNLPLDPGADDADYLRLADHRVIPALEEYRPEFLLLSAGFDAHAQDPLAQLNLSEQGFELLTRSLCALADRDCGGRVVSVLEGGYHLHALARSAVRHALALADGLPIGASST